MYEKHLENKLTNEEMAFLFPRYISSTKMGKYLVEFQRAEN